MRFVDEIEAALRRHDAIRVDADQLDAHPYLLNTPAGPVDLRTGRLGAPDAAQLHTKRTLIGPAGTAGVRIGLSALMLAVAPAGGLPAIATMLGAWAVGSAIAILPVLARFATVDSSTQGS